MYSNYISANMEHTPTVRCVSISVTYREVIAKAFALTSLLGILFILVSQWSEYVAVLDLLDKKLMLMLNFRGSKYTDNFWYDYSQKRLWMPLAAVALWTSVRDYPREMQILVFFLVTILLVAFLDELSSGVIKPLCGDRSRLLTIRLLHRCSIMFSMAIGVACMDLFLVMLRFL